MLQYLWDWIHFEYAYRKLAYTLWSCKRQLRKAEEKHGKNSHMHD